MTTTGTLVRDIKFHHGRALQFFSHKPPISESEIRGGMNNTLYRRGFAWPFQRTHLWRDVAPAKKAALAITENEK